MVYANVKTGKVDKTSFQLDGQPKFQHFLKVSTYSLLFTYKINKVCSDWRTFGSFSLQVHWASLKLLFISAVLKDWRHTCLLHIDINQNTKALFAAVFERVFVIWLGMIFGHLTTCLPMIQWIPLNFDDTNSLNDGLKFVEQLLTWEFATRNGEYNMLNVGTLFRSC
jgi:hypothetical protein